MNVKNAWILMEELPFLVYLCLHCCCEVYEGEMAWWPGPLKNKLLMWNLFFHGLTGNCYYQYQVTVWIIDYHFDKCIWLSLRRPEFDPRTLDQAQFSSLDLLAFLHLYCMSHQVPLCINEMFIPKNWYWFHTANMNIKCT